MQITPCPSPNFGARRHGQTVDLVVLHYTAMASAEAALERLCDPVHEVSSHYLIARDGTIYKLVDEAERAWHAGAGSWGGVGDVNSSSIGIELDNDGDSAFSDALMASLRTLLKDVMARHAVRPQSVIGHSDLAPTRKRDPGPYFDWRGLAKAGLSIWPEPAEPGDFWADAQQFGYSAEAGKACVLDAFRQRFRPFALGPLCDLDRALMADLAARFPAKA